MFPRQLAIAPKTLQSLEAYENEIVDLTPLASHQALRTLFVRQNQITTLAPIAGAPWVSSGCVIISVSANPLDQSTLDTIIPDLCADPDRTLLWEQGECYPDSMRCDVSDP